MKKIVLSILLLISAGPLCAMESNCNNNNNDNLYTNYERAPLQNYPESFGFIPEEQILAECDKIPSELKCVITEYTETHNTNWQKHTYTEYHIQSKTFPSVIKVSGKMSKLRNKISSYGKDPYSKTTCNDTSAAAHLDPPTFQDISSLVTMELIKRAKSDTVIPVKTYPYHKPKGSKFLCDNNYLIVQEKLPAVIKEFSTLSEQEKKTVLKNLDLGEFYRVLKYANLWYPSEEKLGIDTNNLSQIVYLNGEKPDNEGAGVGAKYGIVIFGQAQLDKVKHNIRNDWDGGHRIFENILKKYCNDLAAEWMAYYETDQDVK